MHVQMKTLSLLLIAVALTAYTIAVHGLADRHLYEDPESAVVYWTSGPSGSLFPWPTAPGLLEIITQANSVDAFIYQYLLKTQALTGLAILLWAMTVLGVFCKRNVLAPEAGPKQRDPDETAAGSGFIQRLKASPSPGGRTSGKHERCGGTILLFAPMTFGGLRADSSKKRPASHGFRWSAHRSVPSSN